MAIGKPRGIKRSSAAATGSCSSTVTTVVLVSMCALALWILTSNSTLSPQKTANRINNDSSFDSIKRHRKVPFDPIITPQDNKPVDLSINTSDSEDKHRGFDTNIIEHDDGLKLKEGNDPDMIQETSRDDKYKLEKDENSSGGGELNETEGEVKPESTNDVDDDDDGESLNDSDVGKQEAEEHQEEAREEQEMEISSSVIEEHESEDEVRKKQKIQESDEQHAEENETTENEYDQESDIEDKQTESGGEEDDIRELEDNQEQEITEEEQEKRMEDNNQQEITEEEKEKEETPHEDDGPIESHSIAAETRAQVESREARDVRKKMEQAKISIESIIGNTTTPKKPSKTENSTMVKTYSSEIPNESENQKLVEIKVTASVDMYGYKWELCNVSAGTDYIPCLDNEILIRNLHRWNHNEHQERHCPNKAPMCLVPLPKGYKTPIPWPESRDKIWFHNVPHKALFDGKGSQNWVKVEGEFVTFPRGGARFMHGALRYIDFLQEAVPEISWGKHTRVVLDVGCGVASFGGYLFDRDVLTMSFAPKDEYEAQIQFALERGIPAVSAVMGTQRLPFPSRVFDLVHCVRCKVPWHKEGGILLLELNRVLRPGGYFVWSAPPVYRTLEEDVQIWKEMSALTVAMCWELVTIKKDKLNVIGVAVYRKPDSNECYNERKKQQPTICRPDDDPDAAWYMPLQPCIHNVPTMDTERGSRWPEEWPERVQKPPYWLNKSQTGIYGKPTPNEFIADYEHWKWVVSKSYMSDLGINWSNIRNVMDMRAVYGGFAAALKDLRLWVLNVVNMDSPDTLPIIFERGLFGIYHDWCESFSTYPRTYDLLHADHLFSKLKKRCKIAPVMAEIDRILRPGGNLIAWDESSTIREIEKLLKSMHWEVNSTLTNNQEGIISAQKSTWRPTTYAAIS